MSTLLCLHMSLLILRPQNFVPDWRGLPVSQGVAADLPLSIGHGTRQAALIAAICAAGDTLLAHTLTIPTEILPRSIARYR